MDYKHIDTIIDRANQALLVGTMIYAVVESKVLSWEDKYDFVFGAHKEFDELGFDFEYCVLDTSYEEDIFWYLNSLDKEMIKWKEFSQIVERNE